MLRFAWAIKMIPIMGPTGTAVVINELKRVLGRETGVSIGTERLTQHDLHAEGASILQIVKASLNSAQYDVMAANYGHGADFCEGVLKCAKDTKHLAPAGVGIDAWRAMVAQSFQTKSAAQVGTGNDIRREFKIHPDTQNKARFVIRKHTNHVMQAALGKLDVSLSHKLEKIT